MIASSQILAATIRATLALLASALLGLTASSCGGAVRGTGAASTTVPRPARAAGTATAAGHTHPAAQGGYLRIDGDNDGDDTAHPSPAVNDDQELFETYGRTASQRDTSAIRKLVIAYYTAALAGNGAKVCTLLHTDIATELAAQGGGDSSQSARTACARTMTGLLSQQHQQFVSDEVPTMLVTSVHVKGDIGLAVLGFRKMPEANIVLQRDGQTWKIDALFDSDLT